MKFPYLLLILFITRVSYCSSQIREEYQQCARESADMKDYAGAIKYFSWIIDLNPNDSLAYFDRALMKDAMMDFSGAVLDYSKAITTDSTNADNYFLRGIDYLKLKQYVQALNDLNTTLRMEGDNADAFYYRGLANGALTIFKNALMDYDRAILLNSNNEKYYLHRGILKITMKNKKAGCEDLEKYKQLGGDVNEIKNFGCQHKK